MGCLQAVAVPVWIGTNTGRGTGSEGIYRTEFDPVGGRLSVPVLAVKALSPGFLVQHPVHPVVLAVGRTEEPQPGGSDAVLAFAVGADHGLTFAGAASAGGKGACHLAVDPSGRTVAVANYGDGRIATVRLDKRGVPETLVSVAVNPGSGPNKGRQEGPHAHGVYFDAAGKRLLVPDLGLDRVWAYAFKAETSELGAALPALATAPGAGPRHLVVSRDERFVHVINELDNTVLSASWTETGFKALGTKPTLPEGFSGNNSTAEIELSADGRFLYASNRGHDSIAVFRHDPQTGGLERIQVVPCGGKHPRHFKLSPCGKWLVCAHMQSNTLSVLPRDPVNGTLGEPAGTVACPSPTCILFAR